MDGPEYQRPPLRPNEKSPRKTAASTRTSTSRGRRPAGARRPVAARAPEPSKPKAARRPVRVLLLALLLVVVAASVAGCAAYADIAKGLPDPSKPMLGRDQTSKILDNDGNTIA